MAEDSAAVIARLRALLARKQTIRAAAAELGLSKTTAHRLAQRAKLPRRSNRLTSDQRGTCERLIRDGTLSPVEISRRADVAKSTVSKLKRLILDGETRVAFRPRLLKKPITCPRGHVGLYDPCVVCKARGWI